MAAKRIVAALVLAGAGVLGTAAPAAAVCDPLLSYVLGRCANSCSAVGIVYRHAQDNVEGLPSIECAA